jgi:hypothetical protein
VRKQAIIRAFHLPSPAALWPASSGIQRDAV